MSVSLVPPEVNHEPDTPVAIELIELKLSDKTTVKVKELNGMETLGADRLNGAEVATLAATRALASLRDVNGRKLGPPTSAADIGRRANMLTGREYDTLTTEYTKRFILPEEDAELKNE